MQPQTRETSGVRPSKWIICFCILSATMVTTTEIIPPYATKEQEKKILMEQGKTFGFAILNRWKSILINLKLM